jgi:hypothetical protein
VTGKDLKAHVENPRGWEPSVDASDIGSVSAEDGVGTLRGTGPPVPGFRRSRELGLMALEGPGRLVGRS